MASACPRWRAAWATPLGVIVALLPSTGLGLAVVHGVVTEHGGRVTVERPVGTGTCFDVYLPVPSAEASLRKPDAAA